MIAHLTRFVVAAALVVGSYGFYIPGVQPEEFVKGADVVMKVNAMTSIHTQIPKDYYRLPFCKPEGGPKMASENLGEFVTGNKIQSSAYQINMLTPKYCQVLCQTTLDKKEAAKLSAGQSLSEVWGGSWFATSDSSIQSFQGFREERKVDRNMSENLRNLKHMYC